MMTRPLSCGPHTWRTTRALTTLVTLLLLSPAVFERAAHAQELVRVTPLGSHLGELCQRDRAFLFEDPSGVRILYDPGFNVDQTDSRLGDVHVIRATPACATAGLDAETTVPAPAPCTAPIGAGGTRSIRRSGAADAVRITGVQAAHPSNVPAALFDPPGLPAGTTAYAGLALGFVVQFTNGLTAYLTGDTGMFSEMEDVIARFYRPKLVVINIGPGGNGPTALGPDAAVNVIRHLVRPTTVMPSHVGEQATSDGAVRTGTRTEWFMRFVSPFAEVVLPLSDVTRHFDGEGRCVECK